MTLRTLMATHWFEPEGGAAGHPGVVARSLVARGHELHVVTGFPTYPKGEIFEGYRNRLYQREYVDGLEHRVAELEERLDFTERLLAERNQVAPGPV